MNEEQLKRLYAMAKNIESEIRTDPTGSGDISTCVDELRTTILDELRSFVWGEYYTTELKRYDT